MSQFSRMTDLGKINSHWEVNILPTAIHPRLEHLQCADLMDRHSLMDFKDAKKIKKIL